MSTVLGGDGDADVFERARGLGFAGVEIVLGRAELRSRTPTRLDALRRAKESSGLEIPHLVLGEHNSGGLADADLGVAEAAAQDVRDAIGWARELGAGAVLVPFFLRGELRSDADVARAEAAFRALCPEAAACGVTLLYEGMLPAARVHRLAEGVGSEGFGCYFDLANPLGRGLDAATEIRALAELVRQVHVKDGHVEAGRLPSRARPRRLRRDRARTRGDRIRRLDRARDAARAADLVARDLSFTRAAFSAAREWRRGRASARSPTTSAPARGRFGETFGRLGLEAVQLGDPHS